MNTNTNWTEAVEAGELIHVLEPEFDAEVCATVEGDEDEYTTRATVDLGIFKDAGAAKAAVDKLMALLAADPSILDRA